MIILSISHIGPMQGRATSAPQSPYSVALKKATWKSLLFLHKDHNAGCPVFHRLPAIFPQSLGSHHDSNIC